MIRIGFSTGALSRGDFRAALEMLKGKASNAVELSALRAEELPDLLLSLESLDLSEFDYLSFHAPTDAVDDRELVEQLKRVARLGFVIVVHPDSIRDWEVWLELRDSLSIENMDSRKPMGQTVTDLIKVFERLPKARFCFDIGHARQVDPTMIEAELLLRQFRNRLSHFHMSEVDSSGYHHGMSKGAMESFRKLMMMASEDIPVILESCVDENEIEHEIDMARQSFHSGD